MSNSIRKWVFVLIVPLLVLLILNIVGGSSGHKVPLQQISVDLDDKASLQRGAKYYMNYCFGCHSLNFSRYNRVAKDIGLTSENGFSDDDVSKLIKENLIFTTDEEGKPVKIGTLMKTAYSPKAAAEAFGTSVPDLSLVGRSRGPEWIYSYLKGFYLDPSRPMGVNNIVFPKVGMPDVLINLRGYQVLEHEAGNAEEGEHHGAPKLKLVKPGKLSPPEFDRVVKDLTAFLTYVSEPAQLSRKTYGIFVLLFLILFFFVALALEKEYWKDIH